MSMEDNYNERLARFEEKYPMENDLVNRIPMTFNQIYKNVYSNSTFQGFGNKEVKFNVTKASDGSNKYDRRRFILFGSRSRSNL